MYVCMYVCMYVLPYSDLWRGLRKLPMGSFCSGATGAWWTSARSEVLELGSEVCKAQLGNFQSYVCLYLYMYRGAAYHVYTTALFL